MIGDRLYYVGLLGIVGLVAFVFVYLPLNCLFALLHTACLALYLSPRKSLLVKQQISQEIKNSFIGVAI
jgi:hypothetical protein